MRVTATKLRQNVYAILDEVLEKGIPVEVERKGKILRIVPEKKVSVFDRISPMPDLIIGDPRDLNVHWPFREPENLTAMEPESKARLARKKRSRKKR